MIRSGALTSGEGERRTGPPKRRLARYERLHVEASAASLYRSLALHLVTPIGAVLRLNSAAPVEVKTSLKPPAAAPPPR